MLLLLFTSMAFGQGNGNGNNVYWHTSPNVKTCSMVIDSSLTQGQWHRFIKQSSSILSFRSLASAKTLGKMKFHFAIDDARTPVDQHDLAWINTFSHPDENCPLGDVISFPAFRASMGITNSMDIGGYWTTAPGANYGLAGGEFKYAFLKESGKYPAAAVRTSVSILTGVPDFDVDIASIELMASKQFAMFTPYVGIKQNLVHATETTSKVNLADENLSLTQGYAGIVYSLWRINLTAEYNISTLNTFAFALGLNL